MKYTKDIFDFKDLSQSIKRKLQLDSLKEDPFRDKIFNLFSIAKSQNLDKLNESQIAVGYFRTYTSQNAKDLKTVAQIRAKLRSIIKCDKIYNTTHPNSKIQTLRRVNDERKEYSLA